MELINEDTLSLGKEFSMVPLKLFFNVPAVSVSGLILCTASFLMDVIGAPHRQAWQRLYNLHLMQSTD